MSDQDTCTDIINLRYPDGNLGSPSNPENFNNQDYGQLKQIHRNRRRLYVDNTFPPDINSLGDLDLKNVNIHQVEWLRPADIMKRNNINEEPSFFLNEASRFDFSQGAVGNCWFMAAIASLTFQKDLLVQVVPRNQTFSDYAGIFHFRFWRFGKWVDVVIDDFLPVTGRYTLFAHSKSGKEFWALLLEKAYAKVCGSYGDMTFGDPAEAFKDFSGGVHMRYDLKRAHSASHDVELWGSLARATKCKTMICCVTSPNRLTMGNSVSHTGLVDGHVYSITGVTEVDVLGSKVKLVRLMNPWGKTEWNGDWSDKSRKWDDVRSDDRDYCVKREDGEFWMELEDYCHYFNFMSICCENPNFIDGDVTCQWKCMIHDGKWLAGRTAGGNVNEDTFWKNPQFRLRVKEINRQEIKDKNVLLSLMQKPAQRNRKDMKFIPIDLSVFQVPSGTPDRRLASSFFYGKRPLKQNKVYYGNRELIEMYSMQPGEYVIVPSTVHRNRSGEFVLSVYSKAETGMVAHSDHDDDITEDDHIDIPKPTDRDSEEEMFKRYADQNGELGDRQLLKVLNNTFPNGSYFDLDTCRSMIAVMDTKRSGKMNYSEFLSLWNKFEEFKKIFYRADVSQSGTLSYDELQNAVKASGLDVDNAVVRRMLVRFTGYNTNISLESFLSLMLRMDNSSNIFRTKSKDGVMYMDWNDWSKFMYF